MAERELVNKAVANVFETIFTRMKIADVEKMLTDRKASLYASMNSGTSTQLIVDSVGTKTIESSVSNIIDHDMNTILKVLKESGLFNNSLDESN